MKKFIVCFIILSSIAFAKINTVKDDFNGTEYYQTGVVTLSTAKLDFGGPYGEVRFRTANGDPSKIIMDLSISYTPDKLFTIDNLFIKCSNDYIITIKPISRMSERGINFHTWGKGYHYINFQLLLNEKDIEAIKTQATIIRIEDNNQFYNFKITKQESNKIISTLDELMKFIKK